MISFILPTRNRHEALERTVHAIDKCCDEVHCKAEIIAVDNASDEPIDRRLANAVRVPLRIVRLDSNQGASARNIGAQQARYPWLVMLDDDSYPRDAGFINALMDASPDCAAIGADITLSDGSRERGGLPEVIVGCGAAVRRDKFLDVGGYDPTFDYYVEEYDLCAKFLMRGWNVIHDARVRVHHEKLTSGRDFNTILHRLVRNNGWVAQRYAPQNELARELGEVVGRYGAIAMKEAAAGGFAKGVEELFQTLCKQPRTPMPPMLWDRFTGLAHVRHGLQSMSEWLRHLQSRIAVVDAGKNEWVVRQALSELGATTVADECDADVLVIGTLSPGPMLDAYERRILADRPVICPWAPRHAMSPAWLAA